jgi:hypothetical protein
VRSTAEMARHGYRLALLPASRELRDELPIGAPQ